MVLTLFSLLLTLSITRPLNRLRRAVHDLGQTAYQKDSLACLSGAAMNWAPWRAISTAWANACKA